MKKQSNKCQKCGGSGVIQRGITDSLGSRWIGISPCPECNPTVFEPARGKLKG